MWKRANDTSVSAGSINGDRKKGKSKRAPGRRECGRREESKSSPRGVVGNGLA